jgi:hypothetical protein
MDKNNPKLGYTKVVEMDCEITCRSRVGKRRYSTYYDYTWSECSTAAKRESLMATLRAQSSRCANSVTVTELNITVGPIDVLGRKITDRHKWDSSEHIFDRSSPGTTMIIPVQPGHLGIPWVDDTLIYPVKD